MVVKILDPAPAWLTIAPARDGGYTVSGPTALMPMHPAPMPILFAGTLAQCLDYMGRQLSPATAASPAPGDLEWPLGEMRARPSTAGNDF